MAGGLLQILLAIPVALVAAQSGNSTFWAVSPGAPCQLDRYPVPAEESSQFYECLIPPESASSWIWPGIGVWTKRKCNSGFVFDQTVWTCRSVKAVKRMQQTCGQNPSVPYCGAYNQQQAATGYQIQIQPVYVQPQQPQPIQPQCGGCPQQCPSSCPQPIIQPQQPYIQPTQPIIQPIVQPVIQPQQPCGCPQPTIPQPIPQPCGCPQPTQPVVVQPQPCPNAPATNQGSAGQPCSWMLVGLAADSGPCTYLQCVPNAGPSQPSQFCGIWMSRPCAPGTKFDVTAQVCVWDNMRQCGGAAPSCPCQPIQPVIPTMAPQPCPCQVQPQPVYPTQPVAPQPQVCGGSTFPLGPCNIQQPACPSCQTAPTCPGQSTCYGISGAPQTNTCCAQSIMG